LTTTTSMPIGYEWGSSKVEGRSVGHRERIEHDEIGEGALDHATAVRVQQVPAHAWSSGFGLAPRAAPE